MNWPLAIAGALALLAAAIHGIVGDRLLRDVARGALPANPFGGPETTKTLVRVSWHFVTVTFALSGCALLYVGMGDTARLAPGVTAFLGALYTCLAVFAVSVGVKKNLFRHPAPMVLSAIAALIWWGAMGL